MTKKVLIAGTFDILHPGHIFLINEAAKLGDVYVIVATNENRLKFLGKKPIIPAIQRVEVIKNLKNVKKAILGRKDDKILLSVSKIHPDIILLGPDQKFHEKSLKNNLKKIGLYDIEIRRLAKFYDKFKLNSSSLIKDKIIDTNKDIIIKKIEIINND